MKIKFGAIVVDGSGKLGGHVFAKNKSGNYMRTKTTPSNPQTAFQTAVRAVFASISSAWSTLTSAQRASWSDAVESYKKTNIFGDLKTPSAKALFQRLNQNRSLIGLARLDVAPQPADVPDAGFNSAHANLTEANLEIALAGDTSGNKVLVYATPVVSAGTEFVKNKLRLIGAFDGVDNGSVDIVAQYTARFGPLAVGDKYFVGVRSTNSNGQVSPMNVLVGTIEA